MKKLFLTTLAFLVAGIGLLFLAVAFFDTEQRAAPETPVGYTSAQFDVPHRDVPLTMHLWYPTTDDGPQTLIAQNALFYGFHAIENAAPQQGALPMVVLSHGSGGNARQLGWLTTELARAGFLVAAVDHPGTMSRDSLPERTVMIWERPQDLSALIDQVLQQSPAGVTADPERIGAMGFSLGGFSALSVAGETVSKELFIDYCARNAGLVDCGWMQAAGVDFTSIDQTLYEASYKDPRVRLAVAVDPALPQAVPEGGTAALDMPVLVLNLGNPDTIPAAMRADTLAQRMPEAHYMAIPGAFHFSFLTECSPMGVFMIGVAGDDNICSDRGVRPRAEIHADALARILPFLREEFG